MTYISVAANMDTKLPRLTYNAAGAIDVAAAPGQSSTVKVMLQDGVQRAFNGTLAWDFANGVADLGLDEGVEAVSTWYYMYLVPSAADPMVLTVRASDNTPAAGPTGYTNWKYIGAFRNNAASNIINFLQESASIFKYKYIEPNIYTVAGAYDVAKVTISVVDFVPYTASTIKLRGGLFMNGGVGGWNHHNFYISGSSGGWNSQVADDTFHELHIDGSIWFQSLSQFDMPLLPGTREFLRSIFGTNAANVAGAYAWAVGWIDAYLAW